MELKREMKMKNPIYYAPLVIFQRYKIIILNSCDTPLGSFYCVCTHLIKDGKPKVATKHIFFIFKKVISEERKLALKHEIDLFNVCIIIDKTNLKLEEN